MRLALRVSFVLLAVFALGLSSVRPAGAQCVSLTTLGSPSTQNFDTLSNTAGSTTNVLTITGWFMTETGGGARDNEQYGVDTGSSATGDTYSYGAAASTERALGGLRSGTLIPNFGACFTNNTGSTVTSLAIGYTGEEWRLGTAARTDQINLEYSLNATDLVTGTWTGVPALNFVTPDTVTIGAKNGNAAAERTVLSSTVPALSIANGATFWIRWTDIDVTGADDGLAVDDFSLTPSATPPVNLTINDVSLNEGNLGTTNFTFTVSLSVPAPAGGVTFNIATADGTAQDDTPVTEDNDYVAKSLTGQTIPAGSSTYSFTVLVNGDTTPETNETFFVNVSNISGTGAVITDGQGQGTIVNDDAAPNLTINDVSLNEGNGGTTTFTFTVSLSAPAGTGGVTFDIATADGTAQDDTPVTEDNDYVAKSLTSQTIPSGSSTYTFDVLVNGDLVPEGNETFFVNVTNAVNAIVTDGQGQGTIVNDDLTFIHDVQGSGAATPIPAVTVTVEGVVVANLQGVDKLRGFFLEEEDVDFDADPATSEGIFVFCSTCPTAVAEGQRVRATGPASENFNMTEITASSAGSVVIMDAGNHLAEVTPAPIDLPIAGVVDDFYEAREGMLVTFVDTLTVSEYFELGRFGHLELFEGGRPRQFTETNPPSVAGYAAHLDNLDRRRVILDDDDNGQESYLSLPDGSQSIFYPQANGGFSIGTQGTDFFRGGDLVNGLTGVLHWDFPGFGADTWRIRPTAAHPVTFTVANPRPVTPPAVGGAIKAAGMNLLNYFTTIDTTASTTTGPCGPSGTLDCRGADSVAELNRQRERASIVICTLNADVFGFMELENTTPSATITDLLGAVNARCGGAHPYAFVNTGGTLGTDAIRVQLIYRTGILSPFGSPLTDLDPVHNRPPTAQTFEVVDATNPAFGQRFTVVANHFKSKGCPGTGGDADANDGVSCFNATRTAQATRLLTWITSVVLPAAGDPDVLLLGDFNSYPKETPVTTLNGGGYTDLEVFFQGAAAYSYLFDAQLGHLDYGFANPSLLPQVTGADAWHINADEADLFDYNDEVFDSPGEASFDEKPDGSALAPPRVVYQAGTPYRASDHDPVLVGLFQVADLSITKTDSPDPVIAGMPLTYTVTVTNSGPDPASTTSWSDTLPAGTTFVSLPAVAGWSCTTPLVGLGGTVSCSNPSFAVGSAAFTLTVLVSPSVTAGSVLSNTATTTSTTGDPDTADRSATATTTVAASADLSVTKVDSPDPVTAGANLTYTITVNNAGPSNAASASLSDTLPAGTTFVSLPAVAGWACITPAVGSGGAVSCTNPSFAPGSAVFTLTVAVSPSVTAGTVLSNTATVTSTTSDPDSGDLSATATTTVGASADLSVTKVDTPDPVTAGTNLTYTITVTNAGPSNAASASLSDTLPAGTTFVSLPAVAGWACITPAVGSGGAVSCTNPSFAPGSAVFTLTVAVGSGVTTGTVLTNTATASSATTDPNPGNDSGTATTTVGSGTADLSVTKVDTPDPVTAGTNLTYTITVTNAGPSNATSASLSDTLPAGTTFVSLPAVAGWACITPAVGSGGMVSCSNPSFAVGSAVFTLTVAVGPSVTAGTILSNTAAVTSTTNDPDSADLSATATTTVAGSADLSVTKVDTPDPVTAGTNLTYTITVTNAGPSNAATVSLSDTLPAGTTFVSLPAVAGWACITPAVGSGGMVSCSNPSFAAGSAVFTLTVAVGSGVTTGTIITNTATASSATSDPNPGNQSGTASTTVGVGSADYSILKVDTPDPVNAGSNLTYTLTASNAGPSDAANAAVSDTLPAGTTFVSLSSPAGWNCTMPAVGSGGAVSCTNPSFTIGNAVFTLVVKVDATVAGSTVLSNTATITSSTPDSDTGDTTATATTTVQSPALLSATKTATAQPHTGGTVTYTIVLTNQGPGNQGDNPGDELTDVLPSELALVSASATSGTALANTGTNTVTWNGAIPAGGSVTITIQATILSDLSTPISNQAAFSYDADGDGTNESSGVSDDPNMPGSGDPTVIGVVSVIEIPTLDGLGIALLMALLALAGAWRLSRV